MVEQIKKHFSALKETKSLGDIRKFVAAAVQLAGLSERDARLVVLAIDAAATSIILNAEHHNLRGELSLEIDVDETRLRAVIDDRGEDVPVGPIPNGEMAEFRKNAIKHDLGIFLIRRIMHEVDYEYKRGFINKLVMVRFR